ncbi:MAG: hypothetical protein OHK0056_26660 [Bacteriovoracaceae bacterium]
MGLLKCAKDLGHYQVIIPLIATHTIPYIALITKSLKETRPYSAFQKHLSTYTLVIATMISFGLFEFYIENNFLEFDLSKGPVVLNSIIRSLYLIPLFLHFYSDSIIWKRSYKENLN